MNDFYEISCAPDFLEREQFTRREENSTAPCRKVWYERRFSSFESQLALVIQVEFDCHIADDPHVPSIENYYYAFEGTFLVVIHRGMERYDSLSYDEDTENPQHVGRIRLKASNKS